jgi:AcrR family transcriptional regulator
MASAGQPRTRLAVDTRREQLLRAGVGLLRVRTPDEISVDDVARSAGISRGLLYHYFEDRDAFVVAVLEQASAELRTALRADGQLSGRERIEAAVEAFIGFAEAHAAGFRAVLTGGVANRKVAGLIEQTRERDLDAFVTSVAATTSNPEVARRSNVLRAALHAHMHFMEGAVVRWLTRDEITREQLHELILRALDGTLAAAQSVEAQGSEKRVRDDAQRSTSTIEVETLASRGTRRLR